MAFDVFISYSSKDKACADAVCAALEAAGVRCWIAPRDICAGTEYAEGIIEGIDACRVMVLVFSSNADVSPQIHREVERAIDSRLSIFPFRIEDTMPTKAMEYYLSSIHWLDAYTPPLDSHFGQLVEQVKADLQVSAAGGATAAHVVKKIPPIGETSSGQAAKSFGAHLPAVTGNPVRLALAVIVGLLCAAGLLFWYFSTPTYVLARSAAFGGNGGAAFDDAPSNASYRPITAISVVVAVNSQNRTQQVLRNLQVEWGDKIGPMNGGKNPPPAQRTQLASDEKIGRIDVKWRSYDFATSDHVAPQWVSGLAIWTNTRVLTFGDVTPASTGQCILAYGEILLGFFGRNGEVIDQIGCVIAKPK